MIIAKFGGNTLTSSDSFKTIAQIVTNEKPRIVVLSAMHKCTDELVEISGHLYKKDKEAAGIVIKRLEERFNGIVNELFLNPSYNNLAKQHLKEHFDYIKSFTLDVFTMFEEKEMLAQGELLSTTLFKLYLDETNHDATLISALDFMRIDQYGNPDLAYIHENLQAYLSKTPNNQPVITQGYICRNEYGAIDNLKRGGSDYTATILGSILGCEEIHIYTTGTSYLAHNAEIITTSSHNLNLTYDEAAELAYFGEKLIHPEFVAPAKKYNIPIIIKNLNTSEPDFFRIRNKLIPGTIKALAIKNDISVVSIKSANMLMAYGFMRKVFEVFEAFQTPIDLITTSEVSVTVTIDNPEFVTPICKELSVYGEVTSTNNMVLISLIGHELLKNPTKLSQIFHQMANTPISIISYGSSHHNISLVVENSYKSSLLNNLKILMD